MYNCTFIHISFFKIKTNTICKKVQVGFLFPTVNTLQVFLAEVCDERPEKTQLIGVCEQGCHGELEKPVPRGPEKELCFQFSCFY